MCTLTWKVSSQCPRGNTIGEEGERRDPEGKQEQGCFAPSASEFHVLTGPRGAAGPELHYLAVFPLMTLDADGCPEDGLQN